MAKYNTKYGYIYSANPGLFDVPNLQTYVQNKAGTRLVRLQGPALRAFKAAEARVATKRKPHILITGVGYRSYDLQSSLYSGDTKRFADPDTSFHVEGLAVDIDQGQGYFRLRKIRKALIAEGWHYAVSGEPWHASYHFSG